MTPLPGIERLGWVLVHSLWQFAVLALLAGVVLRSLRHRSAEMRYGALVLILAIAVIAPVATWFQVSFNASSGEYISQSTAGTLPVDALNGDGNESQYAFVNWSSGVSTPITLNTQSGDATSPVSVPSAIARAWSERIAMTVRPWLALLVAVWMIGVALCAVRPLAGCRMLWRLKRLGTSPVTSDVQLALVRISARLEMTRIVNVMQSTLTHAPIVVGYLRPVILLPVSLITSLPMNQLEAILAHELAHVRRHDFVVNLLQTLIETLFFYHPAIWWISWRIRVEREHCCDDLVVSAFNNRVDYGRALLAVEEFRERTTVLALGASDGVLLARVRRLAGLSVDPVARGFLDRWTPVLFCVACLGAISVVGLDLWQAVADRNHEDVSDSRSPVEDVPGTTGDPSSAGSTDESQPPEGRPIERGQPVIAQLPGDISVELVGMTKNTAPAGEGWRPDGLPLGDVGDWPSSIVLHGKGVNSSAYLEGSLQFEPDANAIDLLFRFRGLKTQPSVVFDLPGNGSSFHNLPVKDPWQFRVSTRRRGVPPPGARWTIPDGLIRVGVTEEPWGRYVRISPGGVVLNPIQPDDTYSSTYQLIQVLGTKPYDQAPTGSTISVREPVGQTDPDNPLHRYAFEFRAVDTEGNTHWALAWISQGPDSTRPETQGWNESRYGLAQPLPEGKTLSHYEYRLRPYRHWVTFKNVAMAPDEKTTVTISTDAAPRIAADTELRAEDKADARAAVPAFPLSTHSWLPPRGRNFDEVMVLKYLKKPLEVNFIDTALSDSLAFVSEYYRMPIRLEVKALEMAGIAPDSAVSLKNQSNLQRILNILIVPRGLAWYIDGNAIVVTTWEAAATTLGAGLEDRLLPDIQIIEQICGLTAIQQKKLFIAARGNFIKLVKELEGRAGDVVRAADNEKVASDAYQNMEQLQNQVLTNPFRSRSFFTKAVESTLTPEQMTSYAPIQAILQAGGHVDMRQEGGETVFSAILVGTKLSDRDLAQLKEFRPLQELRLDANELGDDALAHLKEMTNLRTLGLSINKISDKGLAHLKNLKKLILLNVIDNDAITDDGIADLKKSLPNLKVIR